MAELQSELSAGVIALEISSRNTRVQALQERWNLLRHLIAERADSATSSAKKPVYRPRRRRAATAVG